MTRDWQGMAVAGLKRLGLAEKGCDWQGTAVTGWEETGTDRSGQSDVSLGACSLYRKPMTSQTLANRIR